MLKKITRRDDSIVLKYHQIYIFSTNQFFAVQGALPHLASTFLVCKFVITLFYGQDFLIL